MLLSVSHTLLSHRNTMLNYSGLRSFVYGGGVMNSLEHSQSNQLPWGALWDVFACKFSFAGVGFRKAEIDKYFQLSDLRENSASESLNVKHK